MISVAVYCVQPLLATGLQTILSTQGSFDVQTPCSEIDLFVKLAAATKPDVLLLELSPEISMEVLQTLRRVTPSALILWSDTIPTDFAMRAIQIGVRGILRRSLSIDLQVKCLQKVAAGELWVEKSLSDRLLYSQRVSLSPRECQMMRLLAQGLKNKEIAYAMSMTEGTVKVYLSRLFQKVGATDRFELALYAIQNLIAGPHNLPAGSPSHSGASRMPIVPPLVAAEPFPVTMR